VRHTRGVGILRELGAVRAPARAPRKVRAAWGSCLLWGQLVGLAAVCAPKNSSLYGPLAESVVNQTKCEWPNLIAEDVGKAFLLNNHK